MRFLFIFLTILLAIGFILVGIDSANESAADRHRAEATLIRAQSQARMDIATVSLPYAVIGVGTIFGMSLIVLGGIMLLRNSNEVGHGPQREVPRLQIVERIIVVLPEGESRREMWQRIGEVKRINAGD